MGTHTRTLVVSPDPGLVQQVRNALEGRGIAASSVSTATEAIGLVALHSHGLVVAAAELPDQSGYELAADLKQMPDPPVVLLVGGDRDGKAISKSHNAGADGFLHRPLRSAELVGRIQDLMGTGWFETTPEEDADFAPGVTGVAATSMVDPGTGVFEEEENTGYSLAVIDDGGSMDGGAGGNTEELPALAFEAFDEEHHVSVPVSADVTAHGMRPVGPIDTQTPPDGAPAVLGPDTGRHPPVSGRKNAVATTASVDARIAELMEPGGALSAQIESTVAAAVGKALADALPAVLAALAAKDTG